MLTKKYQIVYDADTSRIVLSIEAYDGQETNVPNGLVGVEFDNLNDKEQYIIENNLTDESTEEN